MKLRLFALAGWMLLSQAIPSPARIIDHGDGTATVTDTGLRWVANPRYPITTGFSDEVVMRRVEALRFIAAMNSGAVENFGYRDWRLATFRELLNLYLLPEVRSIRGALGDLEAYLSWLVPRLTTPGAADLVYVWPVRGAGILPGFDQVVLLATNSIHLRQAVHVNSGHVVVNDMSPGPTLDGGLELSLDRNVTTPGSFGVAADSVEIDPGSVVGGNIYYNQINNLGTILGSLNTPLALPVFSVLPPFQEALPRPGAPDVNVGPNQTLAIAAGDYGNIVVGDGGTLSFSGGIYNVLSISANPFSHLLFDAGSEVRVAGRFACGQSSTIGPSSGSGISAASIVFYIAGINGADGGINSTPFAAHIEKTTTVQANFYVPNGRLQFDQDSGATGAFLARDIRADKNSQFLVSSAFANRAPVADSQDVVTNGTEPLEITLTGSDPDGDDLTFSIVSEPNTAIGTLGPVMEDPPPFPGNPPGCNPDNDPGCIPPDPPRTSATVTYTPITTDPNSFIFRVTDANGASADAEVRINQAGDPTNVPPVEHVSANDVFAETVTDTPVSIALDGIGPEGVSLTFEILTLPAGTLSDSENMVIETVPYTLPSSMVNYLPPAGFTGQASFTYQVSGIVEGSPQSDTATATINVAPRPELAVDQSVETDLNTPLLITLMGNPGGAGSSEARQRIQLRALPGASIAGNVADSDGNGFGDNHNSLPGSAPVLISAGVDLTGGPGSNGVARIQIEWDIAALTGEVESASVTLFTQKGTVDFLDTMFSVGTANQDGLLSDSDFEAPTIPIPGVVMPVPSDPVGTDGSFSFDATSELNAAIGASLTFFSIQGHVDESLAGGGSKRGLQVRSTADGNLMAGLEPQLDVVLLPEGALLYEVLTLPTNGILKDLAGSPVFVGQIFTQQPTLVYTPNLNIFGMDGFNYRVTEGNLFDTAHIAINVSTTDQCVLNGRPPGCSP